MSDDRALLTVSLEQLRDEIEQGVDRTLERRRGIDQVTHKTHHDFIESEIERRRQEEQQRNERAASVRRVKENVIGAMMITALSALFGMGYQIFKALREMYRAHGGD